MDEMAIGNSDLPGMEYGMPEKEEGKGSGIGKDKKPGIPKRMNLARFLQIKPQSGGIRSLLIAKFGTLVKTLEEWEIAMKDLLAKKTQ
jgi:hypothetical protein